MWPEEIMQETTSEIRTKSQGKKKRRVEEARSIEHVFLLGTIPTKVKMKLIKCKQGLKREM